ncbi:MAG: hypothetical protein Q8K05_12085 [Polaromonas sp.]|uniref:hypothetical protein n=1 Tax=Polaromonas sp. TaxID=1869339 RepID=UPI00272F6697|nr:hypothetical protein [Polaromonas sp.]MDP2256776.1 hypothetical protein [Polaromonas sp.]MDP3709375.1 hypothetical protein [Polaromonas sp.]
MSFLNWLFGKSAALPPQPPVPEAAIRRERSRLKRHARREQLYVAIREAMMRAGVLSTSYKFKVLSLDQPGEQFMVMMDLAKGFEGSPGQLAEMEALIVHSAKARFEITVPAVYWRLDEVAIVRKPGLASQRAWPRPALQADAAAPPRHEPIQAEEIAAFKQALLAASSQGASVVTQGLSTRSGLHEVAPRTGFEDTEMPESAASPALSSTQYGDLN